MAFARQEAVAAEMDLGKAETLDLRAHRPIENENAPLRRFAQRVGGVPPVRKGGVEDGVERRAHWPRSGLILHNHINMSLYGRQPEGVQASVAGRGGRPWATRKMGGNRPCARRRRDARNRRNAGVADRGHECRKWDCKRPFDLQEREDESPPEAGIGRYP